MVLCPWQYGRYIIVAAFDYVNNMAVVFTRALVHLPQSICITGKGRTRFGILLSNYHISIAMQYSNTALETTAFK